MKHLSLVAITLLIISSFTTPAQTVSTIAGTGVSGYGGDGFPAIFAQLKLPYALSSDASGSIYFVDCLNNSIRKIDTTGIISTVCGNGQSGFNGDSLSASVTLVSVPTGVCHDANGAIYFADNGNYRVRKISVTGSVSTIAGTGIAGYSGDGGSATLAKIGQVINLTCDAAGSIYLAEMSNNRIRKIDTNGIISTIAGTGVQGFSGDSGLAVLAELFSPQGIALDKYGNIYISDTYNHRIRKINSAGIITTIAGIGTNGYSGDGLPADQAEFSFPSAIQVDSVGNVYVVDEINCCIRKIKTNGIVNTIAGVGQWGISNDGLPATNTELYYPKGIRVIGSKVYISDSQSNRIRTFVDVSTSTALPEFTSQSFDIKVYPNPVTTYFVLELPDARNYRLEIYDVFGNLIAMQEHYQSGNKVPVSSLHKGSYFCRLIGVDVYFRCKFIK